jgi:hypothetical protein
MKYAFVALGLGLLFGGCAAAAPEDGDPSALSPTDPSATHVVPGLRAPTEPLRAVAPEHVGAERPASRLHAAPAEESSEERALQRAELREVAPLVAVPPNR